MSIVKHLSSAVIVWAFMLSVMGAQEPQPGSKLTQAPPLLEGKVTPASELGLWDDVFVDQASDVMILRRDEALYSLAMTATATPEQLSRVPSANKTRIFTGAAFESKFWLFVNCSDRVPCAIDARNGTVVSFEIPGLTVPGSQVPEIQSCVIVPHTKSAIIMVSGGDRTSWPRPGNGPLYFWFNLKSGKVIRLPTGWQLNCFSDDETVALFANYNNEGATYHPTDMRTGEASTAWPKENTKYCIPFDWGNKHKVKPLHSWYSWTDGRRGPDFFAGLSVEGVALPIDVGIKEIRYLSMGKMTDGFAGFRLRHNGGNSGDPSPLWITPKGQSTKPEVIARGTIDFAMLGQGNVVFVTDEHEGKREPHKRHVKALIHEQEANTRWDVLEGVERLPELAKEYANANYIEDSMKVRLIESFGSEQKKPMVLSLFEHRQNDLRSNPSIMRAKRVQWGTWRRAITITHDGQRSMTPLFRTGDLPEQFWLHHSGALVTGKYVWSGAEAARQRQVQLSAYTLR